MTLFMETIFLTTTSFLMFNNFIRTLEIEYQKEIQKNRVNSEVKIRRNLEVSDLNV